MRNGPFEGTRIRTSPWPRRATVWDDDDNDNGGGVCRLFYGEGEIARGPGGPWKIHERGIDSSIDSPARSPACK